MCDGRSGQNGAQERCSPQGGGSAKSPVDVLVLVLQDKRGVRSAVTRVLLAWKRNTG
jgi:hypothetical protein